MSEAAIFPSIDPLEGRSKALNPSIIGEEHYRVSTGVLSVLQKYKLLQGKIASLGADALTKEERLVISRARKVQKFLTQPFFMSEAFTGKPGVFVSLSDTIKGFNAIVSGEMDNLPEAVFYMKGGVESLEKQTGHAD